MTRLPRGLSGKEVARALQKADFHVKRPKGSHVVLRRETLFAQVVVPDHRNIDTGTLAHVLDGADLSVEAFIELLK